MAGQPTATATKWWDRLLKAQLKDLLKAVLGRIRILGANSIWLSCITESAHYMVSGLLPLQIQLDLQFSSVQRLIQSWQPLATLSVGAPTMSVGIECVAF